MPHDFTALKTAYPAVIAQMPDVFNAHRFILRLAEGHQKEYVEALYHYVNGNPFQAVHQQLATFLNDFPNLVARFGDDPTSQDIWTNSQACSRWRKAPATQSGALQQGS